jgi:mRNA interferase RelE/StbE
MQSKIEFKSTAIKDLKALPPIQAKHVMLKIKKMEDNLSGDIKRLTNYSPEYRLRIGNYRVLFELKENRIIIYRILHRKDAYT